MLLDDVEIRPLQELSRQELNDVNQGYTSTARYAVNKVETPECLTLTLQLQVLEQPFVKRWYSDDDEFKHYQDIAGMGYSLGAYTGQKLVGLALSEPQFWNRSLWVWEFHISPSYRGLGLGLRMMDRLAESARSKGFRILVCETQNYNVPAIRFYRKSGFNIEGIDLSYYTNTDMIDGEVAIFMKRQL